MRRKVSFEIPQKAIINFAFDYLQLPTREGGYTCWLTSEQTDDPDRKIVISLNYWEDVAE